MSWPRCKSFFSALQIAIGYSLTACLAFSVASLASAQVIRNSPALAVGDVNGDRKPDVVVANTTDNTISVFLNNGDGTFAPPLLFAVGPQPMCVALGDFNEDGHLDVLVGLSHAGSQILLGIGNGSFSPPVPAGDGSCAVADFNGDGHLDIAEGLVVLSLMNPAGPPSSSPLFAPSSSVVLLLGDGHGGFTRQAPFTFFYSQIFFSLSVADINGDGKPDLIGHTRNDHGGTGPSFFLLGDGAGGFSVPTASLFPTASLGDVIPAGDLNGDGHPDFIGGIGGNTVYFGDGQGRILFQRVYPNGLPGPLVDFDGDGKLDSVGVGGYAPGNGHLGFGDLIPIPAIPFPAAIADLDGDVTPDVVNAGSSSITAFLNHSVPPATISASTQTSLFLSADTASVGTSVTLVATVVSNGGVPVGMVSFADGATSLGSAAVNASGVASLTTPGLAAGSHTFAASYGGGKDLTTNTTFGSSSFSSVSLTVVNSIPGSAAPTVTLALSPNPSFEQNQVVLSATVISPSGTPTGAVIFQVDGTAVGVGHLGSFPALQTATATVVFSPGTHTIQAFYGGDGTFPPASSTSMVQSVTAFGASRAASSTTLSLSPNPALVQEHITLSASVSGTSASSPPDIVVKLNGGIWSTIPAPSGSIELVLPAVGTYSFTAEYPGDPVAAPSTSATIVETVVVPPDYSVAANPTSATIKAGQSAMFTVTITPVGGFNSPVSFSCSGLPFGASCSFSPASVTPQGGPASTTLTVTTTAPSAAAEAPIRPNGSVALFALIVGGCFLGLITPIRGAALPSKSARLKRLRAGCMALAFSVLLSCGGGGTTVKPSPQSGTPPSTTQFTVAAQGASNHSIPITVTVTP